VRAHLRRAAPRIVRAALRRLDDTSRLTPSQRSWLLDDLQEDLAAMVDDAENRGVTERAAGEMLVIRALVYWLEGGDQPDADAIGYLERSVKAIPGNPDWDELARRTTYLAAIDDLGGDEVSASGLWRDGVDERTRPLLDLQGRRLRGRMMELGLTIGELAEKSDIDAVRLAGIISGQEEMRATHWLDLSEALDVPLEWMLEGIRFVPRAGPQGRGFYEIEPGMSGSDGPGDAADGIGDKER
jgi:Helix-turn-helix